MTKSDLKYYIALPLFFAYAFIILYPGLLVKWGMDAWRMGRQSKMHPENKRFLRNGALK